MNLGEFIQQNIQVQALPAPAETALQSSLSSLVSHILPPDDTKQFVQTIGDYLRTDDFSKDVARAVGEPAASESEEEFVSRAKLAITEILTKRFRKNS